MLLAIAAGALIFVTAPQTAQAQSAAPDQTTTLAGGSAKAKGKTKPEIAERPQIIGTTSTTDSTAKPGRPASAEDSTETARLISQFQTARSDYLVAQKELKLSLTTQTTEEKRAALREQSKEALERWREQQKRYVEEQKERIKTIKSELQSDLAQRADSVGEGTGSGRDR